MKAVFDSRSLKLSLRNNPAAAFGVLASVMIAPFDAYWVWRGTRRDVCSRNSTNPPMVAGP